MFGEVTLLPACAVVLCAFEGLSPAWCTASITGSTELIPSLNVPARAVPDAAAEVPVADISKIVVLVTSIACQTA